MDRADLSSAIIQEMQALVGEALEAVVPEMLTADLATLEQQAQQVGRVLLGRLIERVAAGHAQLLPRPVCCAACGGKLKRRERPRPLVGWVVARATVDAPFTPAVEQLQETLGATLSDETARRLAEQIGAVAEAQTQAAIARAQQGQPAWAEAEIQSADDTTTLAVEVDGVWSCCVMARAGSGSGHAPSWTC